MTAPKLTPRKAPRQGRARATVEAILTAAEQLTRERGIEEWTTNHVAERAGASIGSLYQYFPSKESLVTALYLHRRTGHLALLASALAPLGDAAADRARTAAKVARLWQGLDEPTVDWPLDTSLRDFLERAGAARKLVALDEQTRRLLAQVARRCGRDEATAARSAFVVLRALEAALAALSREHPAWLREPGLADELAALLAPLWR